MKRITSALLFVLLIPVVPVLAVDPPSPPVPSIIAWFDRERFTASFAADGDLRRLTWHPETPRLRDAGSGVLQHDRSAILVALSDEKKADPPAPIRLPVGPILPTPPAPPAPSPLSPTILTADLLFVIDSDVECLIHTSPAGLVDVTKDSGPLKIRGRFCDGVPGKSETRLYTGKWIYTITAAQTGKCELLIFPVGATKDSDIISRMLDCQLGPAPPIPPGPGPGPGPGPQPTDPFTKALQAAYDADTGADKAKSLDFLQKTYKSMSLAALALPNSTNTAVVAWMKSIVENPTSGLAAAQLKGVRTAISSDLLAAWGAAAAPLTAANAAAELQKISDALAGVK